MSDQRKDSFAALFEGGAAPKRRRLRVGDRIEAVVVRVSRDTVFVALDGKEQAFLDRGELDGAEVAVGDRVTAQVVEIDDVRGIVRLGRSGGKGGGVAALERAREARLPVEGKVSGVNKGGLEVDLGGVRGFCPMSQADDRFVEDPGTFVGRSLTFLVTDVRDGGKNVVVSRRAFLEQEASAVRAQALSAVVVGAVLNGTVTAVRDFGAFVDIGGVEGLIPRSELGGSSDAVTAGQAVEVVVREVKEVVPTRKGGSTHKITLALGGEASAAVARAAAAPGISVGAIVKGTVERVETYGVFVQLEGSKGRGGRGLVPNEELGVPRGTDNRKTFPAGTAVVAKVLETGEGKLRLSFKGAKDDEERSQFEAARPASPASLGTFADLLKKKS